MVAGAEASEGADDDAVVEAAFRYNAMRFNRYAFAESSVLQDAASADAAARAEARLAEQLNSRLEDGVFARDNVGIDEDRLRQLKRDTGGHELVTLAFAESAIDFGEIRAGIAAEYFAGIRSDLGEHRFACSGEDGDGVGEVKLAMLVVGLDLRESGPEFCERKTIDAGIDFVEVALFLVELRLFDDGSDRSLGLADHAAVTGGIGQNSSQQSGGSVTCAV